MKGSTKGVLIGGGLLGVAVIFLLLRKRAAAANAPNTSPGSIATLQTTYNPNGTFNTNQTVTVGSNPNLIMVSSANTNVNEYQNSSYMQALSAEAELSTRLSQLIASQPKKAALGPPLTTINPGGPIQPKPPLNTTATGVSGVLNKLPTTGIIGGL